jgi:hypothetical protein
MPQRENAFKTLLGDKMKKYVLISALALMVTAGIANAADLPAVPSVPGVPAVPGVPGDQDHDHDHNHGRGLFRFDFRCDFRRDDHHPMDATMDDGHDDRGCRADATVFAFVDDRRDWMSSMEQFRDPLNRFTVTCDGRLIYADSAILNPRDPRGVSIRGIPGLPELFVERNENDREALSLTPEWMEHRATLRTRRDDRQEGTCQVQAMPADDHGHDHDHGIPVDSSSVLQ